MLNIIEEIEVFYKRKTKAECIITLDQKGNELVKEANLKSKNGKINCQIYHHAFNYIGKPTPGFSHNLKLKLEFNSTKIKDKAEYLGLCDLVEDVLKKNSPIIKGLY